MYLCESLREPIVSGASGGVNLIFGGVADWLKRHLQDTVINPILEVMELITVTEAAKRLGLSGRWIRMLIEQGRIEATQYGRTWVLEAAALEAYMRNRRPVGRPALASNSKSGKVKS